MIYKDRTVIVSNPTEFPDITDTTTKVREVQEPMVKASIIVPDGQLPLFALAIQASYNSINPI